jgi:predicted nucleic acid-binding protein
VIAYVDSSLLVRAYLPDETGHAEAVAIIGDPDLALITGTWARIEVSGALVRAARAGHGDEERLLSLLDADLAAEGAVTIVTAPQADVEERALGIVRVHGIRALDAWHLATAAIAFPALAEPAEEVGFASRDQAQSEVAAALGFRCL